MHLYKNVVLYLLVNDYKIYQEGKYHMIRQGENQENKKDKSSEVMERL